MRRSVFGLIAVALVLAGCGVPRERDDLTLNKVAARSATVDDIFQRYRTVRNTAKDLLDPKPLSTVETGPVLAIDSGSFEVSQRLSTTQDLASQRLIISQVETPEFGRYPLWFVATAFDPVAKVNRVQVFERSSAADPWLLVASPQTVVDTTLPDLRHAGDGSALRVKTSSSAGMAMSPQDAADAYAAVLAAPPSAETGSIARDDFIEQMRKAAQTNGSLKGVSFSQTWDAQKVKYALRTDDGGALVFVTLERADTYEADKGVTVTWPAGSPQEAFLSSGISSSGTLQYLHQVLLYLPGGNKPPRALGQYGGVVGADGQ